MGFIRGGNWNNGANAGAFTLNLNNSPANVNTNIGFRCAQYFSFLARAKYLWIFCPCLENYRSNSFPSKQEMLKGKILSPYPRKVGVGKTETSFLG